MDLVTKFSIVLIFVAINFNFNSGESHCTKNEIDYTFAQKEWTISPAGPSDFPYVVSVSLRDSHDFTHCQWCSGLILGKRHVLVVNCGKPSTTIYPLSPTAKIGTPLSPQRFLVHKGIDIPKLNASETLLETYASKDWLKVKNVVSFYPRYSPKDLVNIVPYLIFQDLVNLLILEEPLTFDDSTGCLPVSKTKSFILPRESEVTSLQWCYDNKGNHSHDERTYTLHSVVAKRDCGKWDKEDDYAGRRLAQTCIAVDDRRPQLNLDYPCQRTFGNILIHNDTYSFTIDARHSAKDFNNIYDGQIYSTKPPIIDEYPIYYLKFTSELTEKLEWIMGKEKCEH